MQYASTFPFSTSTIASGPFSNRGSVPPAGVPAGAAFFPPGRCDVDDGLVVRAGRGAAAGAAATGVGLVWVFSDAVMAAAWGAGSVDSDSVGPGVPVNVAGAAASWAGTAAPLAG